MKASRTASLATILNNEGISQLKHENYEAAVASFSRGLAIVKQALGSNEWESLSSKPSRETQTPEESPACQFCKLQDEDIDGNLDKEEEQEPFGQEGFVFKEPIMVLPQSLAAPNYNFFVKLSFLQLYNLALTHHLSALDQPEPEPFLRKALSLYELAYAIHVSEHVELTILQSMAIVNNLGHLHRQLGDQKKSQQCFETLLTTLMLVKDCGENESHHLLDGFMSNVISLILCRPKPAEAA